MPLMHNHLQQLLEQSLAMMALDGAPLEPERTLRSLGLDELRVLDFLYRVELDVGVTFSSDQSRQFCELTVRQALDRIAGAEATAAAAH